MKIGYAHKPNFLKFRILEALYNTWLEDKEPLTTRDIERITGVQYTAVSSVMSRYQKIQKRNGKIIKLPYIQRLEKKGPNGLYRYKITKKGIEAYANYLNRIQRGVSLNRVAKRSQHMETYGKFPVSRHITTKEDLKLLPEQLLPYYSITTYGQQYIKKKETILYMENRMREIVSGEVELE